MNLVFILKELAVLTTCNDDYCHSIRSLLYVTIQPFWTKVRRKVYSGRKCKFYFG